MKASPAVPGQIINDEILPARAYWHKRLSKGTVLRIVDLEGCQAVDTLIYDAVDTAIRYIAANSHPDHDTIASFRRRFLPEIKGLFVQILMVANELEVLKLGSVSLDGTKVKANASKHKALSYGHACKLEELLESEVADLLTKAESADKADIPDGMVIEQESPPRVSRARINPLGEWSPCGTDSSPTWLAVWRG